MVYPALQTIAKGGWLRLIDAALDWRLGVGSKRYLHVVEIWAGGTEGWDTFNFYRLKLVTLA